MTQVWEPIPPVSEELARAVRDIVIEHFRSWTHDPDGNLLPGEELPELKAPGTGWGDHWCLLWTGLATATPYEWPTLATLGGREEYTGAAVAPASFPPELLCEAASLSELSICPR